MNQVQRLFFLTALMVTCQLAAVWDHAEIAEIKQDPTKAKAYFFKNRKAFRNVTYALLSGLSKEELFFIYCQAIAHHVAPYGPGNDIELPDMLKAPRLNCGNYGLLGIRIAEAAWPEAIRKVHLHLTGWRGGAIGNHQVLFLVSHPHEYLVDPTVGLLAKISFDEFASGKPLEHKHIVHFGKANANPWLLQRMMDVLTQGLCRPRDLMYYYGSADRYLYPLPSSRWPTPAIQR